MFDPYLKRGYLGEQLRFQDALFVGRVDVDIQGIGAVEVPVEIPLADPDGVVRVEPFGKLGFKPDVGEAPGRGQKNDDENGGDQMRASHGQARYPVEAPVEQPLQAHQVASARTPFGRGHE